MARAAAADGAGLPAGGRLTDADGLGAGPDGLGPAADGLGTTLGPTVGLTGVGVTAGVELGLAGGGIRLERGDELGVGLGPGLALGAGLVVGRTGTFRTYRLVPAWFRVGPMAMAWWPLEGDRTTELGTVGRLARPREIPASGAQSGSSPAGQTLFTLAVTIDRPLAPLVTTQVTWESTIS